MYYVTSKFFKKKLSREMMTISLSIYFIYI